MAKNIVLCSDGTGNSTIKNRGTNVYKLYEAVDLEPAADGRAQVVFYDDGVGTGGLKPLRVLGGAFGYGFARNVRDLYTDLSRVYRPGDSIYLFGFSRGAYTVRALAGLIATCGVLDTTALSEAALRDGVDEAYRVYRLRFRPERDQPAAAEQAAQFRRTRAVHQPGAPVRIAFIGVWDTVGAVGLPDDAILKKALWILTRYRIPWFKHYRLGDIVDRACHALAIDDERQTFHPILWDGRREDGTSDPRLEQVWFAGVHSNVGGGYAKQGMSLVTLDWMMEHARAAGLRFSRIDAALYHERRNVHDWLYDSRGGLKFLYRYSPRDVRALSEKYGSAPPQVHVSVLDRIGLRTEGYAPGNVPGGSVVVGENDPVRRAKLEAALNTTLGTRLPLDGVRGLIKARQTAHIAALTALIALGLAMLAHGIATKGLLATASALVSVNRLAALAWDVVTGYPIPMAVLAVVAIVGWVASWRLRRRMQDRFADIWHTAANELRPLG
jgi:uncharacterized protein (DUF2235 family)